MKRKKNKFFINIIKPTEEDIYYYYSEYNKPCKIYYQIKKNKFLNCPYCIKKLKENK